MSTFTLQNPVFVAYLIAASIMILKLMLQGWVTVAQMMRTGAGLLNPEDLLAGPANPRPSPTQLELNSSVERSRRIQRNDLENVPAFLAAGLLLVAVEPSLILAAWLYFGFVAARLAHTLAYSLGARHEIRASFYSIGSLIVIAMAGLTLASAMSQF